MGRAGYREGDRSVAYGMVLPALVDSLKARLRAGRVSSEGAGASAQSGMKRISVGGGCGDTGARFVKP